MYPGSPDFNKLKQIQAGYFNSALINVIWSNLQPNGALQPNFEGVDWSVNFARKMKGLSFGLSLICAGDTPEVIRNGNYSRDELIYIMTNHITNVMTRYKNTIHAWAVVNEPYAPPYRTDDIFYRIIGPDYIEIAFQAARESDPTATLVYNDTLNHAPAGRNGMMTNLTKEIVENLRTKNLVDAVGLQMHLDGSIPPTKEEMIKTMKSYGLPIYITEFDVNMKEVRGTPQERALKQAEIYRNVIEAAIESGRCEAIFIFQVGDRFSVWENFPGQGFSKNADPTPFDDNLNPKPAYYAILQALLNSSTP